MINKAGWIWHLEENEVNEYCEFIHLFSLDTVDPNAVMHISVDSEYAVWINGEFVNCGQFSDFPQNKIYDTLEIGQYLKKGENRLCVSGYYQGVSSLRYFKGQRGLVFAIKNDDEEIVSGEKTLCRISRTYQSGELHKTTWQMGYGYFYDARGNDGWLLEGYEPEDEWHRAEIQQIVTNLSERPIKKNRIEERVTAEIIAQGIFIRKKAEGTTADLMSRDFMSCRKFEDIFKGHRSFPVTLEAKEQDGDGVYFIVDLKRESCGFLCLSLKGGRGTRVDVAYGEHLEDLRVRCRIGERNFADTYICGGKEETFVHYYRRIAGRYLQVHITGFNRLTVNYTGLLPVNYPIGVERSFYCNDSLHNAIYKTCVDTLKLCMHEHYEDTPWREQALYGSDSRNAALCAYYAFGEEAHGFTKASLDLLLQSLRKDNFISLTAPGEFQKVIPSFTMLWMLAVKEYTQYSGDYYFTEKHWDTIRDMADSYCTHMKNGLPYAKLKEDEIWAFYEWAEDYSSYLRTIQENKDVSDGLYCIFVYIAISSAAWLARSNGKYRQAEEYDAVLRGLKTTFNSVFWDESKGVFASHVLDGKPIRYDELTQALAVFSEICDEARTDRVLAVLADKGNELCKVSLSYSVYKYDALLSKGMKYAEDVLAEIRDKWGKMLFSGATSFWETERGANDFSGAGSLCHAWAAIPLYIYGKYVAGGWAP